MTLEAYKLLSCGKCLFLKNNNNNKKGNKAKRKDYLHKERKMILAQGKKKRGGGGKNGGGGRFYPKVGIFMLMKIIYLYLGLPWESMERWKGTQRKICVFKRTLGLQNLDHFKGHEKMHVHSA